MHLRTMICHVRAESGGFEARMGGVRTDGRCVLRAPSKYPGQGACSEGRAHWFLRLIALNCAFLRLFQIYIFLSLRTAKMGEGNGSANGLYTEAERDGKIYLLLPLITSFYRVFGGMGEGV
jgi:hypothetical protein